MKQLIMRNLKDVKEKIRKASDSELLNPDYESKLLKSYVIEKPYLETHKISTDIGEEVVNIKDAPDNFPIGANAYFALIGVSIRGSMEVFLSKASHLPSG